MQRNDVIEMIGIVIAFAAIGLVAYGVYQVVPWLSWVIGGAFLLIVALLLIGSANGVSARRARERDA